MTVRILCLVFSYLSLAIAPASAQSPFFFPPASGSFSGTVVSAISLARSSDRLTLDVVGSPVAFCWRDGGLLGKACDLIAVDENIGLAGFRPNSSSDFYDVRSLIIYHSEFAAEPGWSVPLGCVTAVDEQPGVGGAKIISLSSGTDIKEARCWTNVGGLMSKVCAVLEPGDCATFEGIPNVGAYDALTQIIARKGYTGF